jgi:hypothetical protein
MLENTSIVEPQESQEGRKEKEPFIHGFNK